MNAKQRAELKQDLLRRRKAIDEKRWLFPEQKERALKEYAKLVYYLLNNKVARRNS